MTTISTGTALDPVTENALVNALHTVSHDHLVVTIAHLHSTIRQADRIISLESGSILDVGGHSELMAKPDSACRRFVELQLGG